MLESTVTPEKHGKFFLIDNAELQKNQLKNTSNVVNAANDLKNNILIVQSAHDAMKSGGVLRKV